jgi:hypothetical protein
MANPMGLHCKTHFLNVPTPQAFQDADDQRNAPTAAL